SLHWVFYINVSLGLVSIILSFIFYRGIRKPNVNTVFDRLGAFTLIGGLTCFLIGIQMLGLASNLLVALFIIIGIAMLVWFILVEKKPEGRIVQLFVFTKKALVAVFIFFAFPWAPSIALNTNLPLC